MDRYDCLYEKYRSQMSTVISDGLAAREEFQALSAFLQDHKLFTIGEVWDELLLYC